MRHQEEQQHSHRAIESLTMDKVMHVRDTLIPKISQLIYNGFGFHQRQSLMAFIKESQVNVTGDVKLLLYKAM